MEGKDRRRTGEKPLEVDTCAHNKLLCINADCYLRAIERARFWTLF